MFIELKFIPLILYIITLYVVLFYRCFNRNKKGGGLKCDSLKK